jgi:DNA-directed RNA polymerase subunit H
MAKKTTTRKPVKVLKKKAVKAPSKKKVAAEKAVQEEDLFDPRKHNLVALHELLDQEQVEHLFTVYKASPQSLPVIFMSDPALKGLNAKMGDIIRITRPSPTAGTAVFYRRVSYE